MLVMVGVLGCFGMFWWEVLWVVGVVVMGWLDWLFGVGLLLYILVLLGMSELELVVVDVWVIGVFLDSYLI